jgi:Cys-rich four helix bundle protein (predicted Tat secretion target)
MHAKSSEPAAAMGRRELVLGTAAAAAAAVLATGARPAAAAARPALTALAGTCVEVGEECLSHCLQSFSGGDTALAGCARTVHEMIPVCTALGRLAATESKHLPALAKVCASVCEDCEKECRKHEKEHDVCKRCAEACSALLAGLRELRNV